MSVYFRSIKTVTASSEEDAREQMKEDAKAEARGVDCRPMIDACEKVGENEYKLVCMNEIYGEIEFLTESHQEEMGDAVVEHIPDSVILHDVWFGRSVEAHVEYEFRSRGQRLQFGESETGGVDISLDRNAAVEGHAKREASHLFGTDNIEIIDIEKIDGDTYRAEVGVKFTTYDDVLSGITREAFKSYSPTGDWDEFSVVV